MTRFHDAYLRTTPVELLLPEDPTTSDRWERIRDEARQLGGVPEDPMRFMALNEVAGLLAEVRAGGEPSDLVPPYAALVLHGLHWHEAGRLCLSLKTEAARFVLAAEWEAPTDPRPPASAGYVQLPGNLFWVDQGDGNPEPVEGLHWVWAEERLSVLLAAGMRPDRPGLSVFWLEAVPWDEIVHLVGTSVREDGADFATTLPGGELSGLHTIATAGEAFKLALLIFGLIEAFPEALTAELTAEAGDGPSPSAFPYRMVRSPHSTS